MYYSTIGRGGDYACPECDPMSEMLSTQGRQISQTSTASLRASACVSLQYSMYATTRPTRCSRWVT
jgi:hypothetical protein